MSDIKTMVRYYCEYSEPPTVILEDPSGKDEAIRIHTTHTDEGVWLSPEDAEGLGAALIAMAARARKARGTELCASTHADGKICQKQKGHKGSHVNASFAWPNTGAKNGN